MFHFRSQIRLPNRPGGRFLARMGYKRVETLGDVVRFGLVLKITCLGCGRTREVPATRLYWKFRPSTPLRKVGPRLRCHGSDLDEVGCGYRGALVDFVIPMPPDPPPDDDGGGDKVVSILSRLAASEPFYDHAKLARRRRR